MLRRALVWIFAHIVDIYFSSVESTGAEPAADTAGRLFVSNHVNGLIDPLLVLTAAPCPISPVAKSTLWNIPGLRWLLDAADAVPIVRRRDNPNKGKGANEAAFERIASWLRDGGNILIFPEGTSHNEPYVLKVRTGASRMLTRAYRSGAEGATFQAVALEFDARDVFRSRCLLVYGPVRNVAELARNATSDDELVKLITQVVQDDLEELIVEGKTWEDRVLIARVAEMIAHDGGDASLAAWNEIGRQVEAAERALDALDASRVAAVRREVDAYHALLDREGLHDVQVADAVHGRAPRASVAALLGFLLAAPLAAVGTVLYWLPYQAPRLVAKTAKEPDVVSTYKLGTGLVLFPLWAAALVVVGFMLLSTPYAAAAAAVVVASPFCVLLLRDRSRPLRRHLRVTRRQRRLEPVRVARARAMEEIQNTRSFLDDRA